MYNLILVFVSYFLVIFISFSVVTITSSNTTNQMKKFLQGSAILAGTVAAILSILMELMGNEVSLPFVFTLIILGFIEENIFIPIIMQGKEFKSFPRKAIIMTVIIAEIMQSVKN